MRTIHSNKTTDHIQYDIKDEPLVISKHAMDLMLQTDNPAGCIALYCFYYYTAKWQGTDQPKVTAQYVINRMGWGINKFKKFKAILKDLDLIQDVVKRGSDNKIIGHYIKVNFQRCRFPPYGFRHPVESRSINTLKTINKMLERKEYLNAKGTITARTSEDELKQEPKETTLWGTKVKKEDFFKFMEIYPKKAQQGLAQKAWLELCKKPDRPTWMTIRQAVRQQKKTEQWNNPQFIPLAKNWVNDFRWLDDPAEMKIFRKENTNTPISGFQAEDWSGVKYEEL